MNDIQKKAADHYDVDVIIVGQGVCGTFLSRHLQQRNISFIVIDEAAPMAASKVAAGIINPVTGRRIVKTWMIDEVMPFAVNAYQQLGNELGIDCIATRPIIEFFPTPQMRLGFTDRFAEGTPYLEMPDDEQAFAEYFNYGLGYGLIAPAYMADLKLLLAAWRQHLVSKQQLTTDRFDEQQIVEQPDGIAYDGIFARKLIYCNGVEAANSKYFSKLPFAPNKGEALIIEAAGLPESFIFKKGYSLAPMGNGRYWLGSSYEWTFTNLDPSPAFRAFAEQTLQHWLKVPFKVVDHLAGVRPATLERRPFVGFHPASPHMGILGGMGSKGCSLAPYFAAQMASHIGDGSMISKEADISRFSRILNR